MNHSPSNRKCRKVIHVVQHLAPGGIESLALDLLHFAHPNDQVLIVSLEGNKQQALSNWPRLKQIQDKIVFLEKTPGVQLGLVLTLIRAFNGVRPDVVHTHHIGPLLYAGYAARITGVPVRIHTEHDAWHLNNNKHVRLQGLVLKVAKPTLVADATHVEEKLTSCFSYTNSVVIKNGVDCKKFKPGSRQLARELFDLPMDKKIVGTAGRLERIKGHDIFINSVMNLGEDTLAVIAGEGSQRLALEKKVRRLGLQHRVRFLGLVEDMPRFYQALDVFCLPSRFEGFPLSPLEAQACNIPALVTDVGASSEAVCPVTGNLIPPEDTEIMALAINKMFDRDLTLLPREFVVKNNDIRQMVRAYEDLAMGALA
mgnify:CR=1 FL=1